MPRIPRWNAVGPLLVSQRHCQPSHLETLKKKQRETEAKTKQKTHTHTHLHTHTQTQTQTHTQHGNLSKSLQRLLPAAKFQSGHGGKAHARPLAEFAATHSLTHRPTTPHSPYPCGSRPSRSTGQPLRSHNTQTPLQQCSHSSSKPNAQ